jgi:hypothetical protein
MFLFEKIKLPESFEVNDGDKTIRTASNHEYFANIFHFLRKACSEPELLLQHATCYIILVI